MSELSDPGQACSAALELEQAGEDGRAAAQLDQAYGRFPQDAALRRERSRLLDRLALIHRGISFRYIPAGPCQIGSEQGDEDERPVHQVDLPEFWISEATISWAQLCRGLGWGAPPDGTPLSESSWVRLRRWMGWSAPPAPSFDENFAMAQATKLRLQYCEDETLRAIDWHAHHPKLQGMFGAPPRRSQAPYRYEQKPAIAVSCLLAEALGQALSEPGWTCGLPSEVEWEKAARGGLASQPYPWGADPPSPQNCDFRRFDEFSILPVRTFPPNGYGLYAMCGSVWEWTSTDYDAQAYLGGPAAEPAQKERVLRGGSWADCADTVTVSFRFSRPSDYGYSPNIGFRLCLRKSL